MSSSATPLAFDRTGIDDAAAARYRADGFLIVRQLFTAGEIAALDTDTRQLLDRTDLMDTNNLRCRWQDHVDTGECRFDCFDPVIDLSATCERAARDPRLLALVSRLYGEPACLFKDKLIFKAPGMPGYTLHQDYIAWASFPTTFMTVIVAIDPADAGNGATEVFPGYHLEGALTPRDGNYHALSEDAVDVTTGVVLDLAPGDVAMFSGYTPHRSAANRSSQWRRLLYLSYNAISDGGDQRTRHYQEFHAWLQDRYAEHGRTFTFFR
jgi:ectoine hydroxylase-related dioxygenase (phytanoyl-CoA dioxygenase family)